MPTTPPGWKPPGHRPTAVNPPKLRCAWGYPEAVVAVGRVSHAAGRDPEDRGDRCASRVGGSICAVSAIDSHCRRTRWKRRPVGAGRRGACCGPGGEQIERVARREESGDSEPVVPRRGDYVEARGPETHASPFAGLEQPRRWDRTIDCDAAWRAPIDGREPVARADLHQHRHAAGRVAGAEQGAADPAGETTKLCVPSGRLPRPAVRRVGSGPERPAFSARR